MGGHLRSDALTLDHPEQSRFICQRQIFIRYFSQILDNFDEIGAVVEQLCSKKEPTLVRLYLISKNSL